VRLLAERDVPSTGTDFFMLSYPSLADALAGTGLTQQSMPLPLIDSYSISGMTIELPPTPPVPEMPSSALLAAGLAAMAWMARRSARRPVAPAMCC